MIELKRDQKTGEVVAYEDGRPVGLVTTMGDMLDGSPSKVPMQASEMYREGGRHGDRRRDS